MTEPVTAAVLFVPPWAEEMNKSRRMVALQCRTLAACGAAVLVPDLLGCGDSPGTLADARWQGWLDDLVTAAQWLQQRTDCSVSLWSLRAGGLLASQLAARLDDVARVVLWQPPASGKLVLQQFLRLKVLGAAMAGQNKGAMEALKAALSSQGQVNIAGYALNAELAQGLERATMDPPSKALSVHMFEVSPQADATLLPTTQRTAQAWREAGHTVDAQVLAGSAFWQSTEIETAPALLAPTVAAPVGGSA